MDTQKPNEGSGSKVGQTGSSQSNSQSSTTGSSQSSLGQSSSQKSGQTGSSQSGSTLSGSPSSQSGSQTNKQSGSSASSSSSPSASSMSGGIGNSQSTSGAGSSSATGSSGGAMAAHETGNQHSSSLGAIGNKTDRVHDTIDKAAQSAQPIVERLASTAHAAVDKVQHSLSGMQGTMGDKQRQLAESANHYLDSGREYVRMKPATAIAGAFVAGFLLAKMFGGSNRH